MNPTLINVLAELFEILTRDKFVQQDSETFKKQLLHELQGVKWHFTTESKKNYSTYRKHFLFEDLWLQLLIFLHLRLFLIISENFPLLENSFKHIKSDSFSYMAFVGLRPTLTHLINSLLSIRLLLSNGFDNQAGQLIRSYIEYADIGVALLSNEEFFENYKQMVDSEEKEKEVWWKYVRHDSMTKILRRSLKNISKNENHWDPIFQVRKAVYKQTSDIVHGHSGANFFGVYTTPFGEDKGSKLSLGGETSKEMKDTILHIDLYSHFFLENVCACTVHYHKLPFKHFGEEGEFFVRVLGISQQFKKLVVKSRINTNDGKN